jgi:7-cyano-7-deazaguanine synthase
MRTSRAVVLLSGGMDSCVTAALARQTFEPAFLHLNYGQRTEARELRAFRDIADYYKVGLRLIASMEHLAKIGGSSLTDRDLAVPRANLTATGIPVTYVPFRNANMLSVAVSWAEVIGASAVFIGAVEEDSCGYPDCRRQFYDAFNAVVELGTRPGSGIRVVTPVIGMSKKEIVEKGVELGAPLHLTWSCYLNEDVACGECDSCALRLRAFEQAGVVDPIPYQKRPHYS